MFSRWVTGTSSATTGFRTLTGFIFQETAGAVATVTVRDQSAGGILWGVNLAAKETVGDQFGENPVASEFGRDFYVSVDAGTVRWTVFGK